MKCIPLNLDSVLFASTTKFFSVSWSITDIVQARSAQLLGALIRIASDEKVLCDDSECLNRQPDKKRDIVDLSFGTAYL